MNLLPFPDMSDDVYGHSVEDYDLAVSPATGMIDSFDS